MKYAVAIWDPQNSWRNYVVELQDGHSMVYGQYNTATAMIKKVRFGHPKKAVLSQILCQDYAFKIPQIYMYFECILFSTDNSVNNIVISKETGR